MPADAEMLILKVGRRVAELRVEAGLTQAELADKANVSVKYLQRIEAGQENLTLRSLAGLADVYGVEVVAFFQPPAMLSTQRGRPPKNRDPSAEGE